MKNRSVWNDYLNLYVQIFWFVYIFFLVNLNIYDFLFAEIINFKYLYLYWPKIVILNLSVILFSCKTHICYTLPFFWKDPWHPFVIIRTQLMAFYYSKHHLKWSYRVLAAIIHKKTIIFNTYTNKGHQAKKEEEGKPWCKNATFWRSSTGTTKADSSRKARTSWELITNIWDINSLLHCSTLKLWNSTFFNAQISHEVHNRCI